MTITVQNDGSISVTGDDARRCNVIRLDSFKVVNRGELVEANEVNGFVRWIGNGNDITTATLGPKAIKIAKKLPRGR